ncbi:MAG: O-antigen ligase family protein [Bacteroidales bacterium]|nr:O-antigen ligase family protein [Bacteroidales bacterium]
MFDIAMLLLASIFTVIFVRTRPKINFIDILALALGLLIIFNYYFITTVNTEGKFISFIFLIIAYFSLRIIFSAYKNTISFAIITVIFCGLIEAICGVTQLLGLSNSNHDLYCMTGTFFNPGPYGGYLAIIMAIAIAYIIRYSNWFKRYSTSIKNPIQWLKHPAMIGYILSYCAFIASFIIFFAIMSRAAILAFAVSLIVLILMSRSIRNKIVKYLKSNKNKALVILSVLFVLICSVTYFAYNFKQDSADGRVFMWKIASTIISENPITGVGIGAYCGEYAKAQANYFITNPSSDFIHVAGAPEFGFNEYLQIGVELGLLGMLLFMAIMIGSVYVLLRNKNCFAYGLLTLAVFAFFAYPLSLLPFQVLIVVFIASSCSFRSVTINSKWVSIKFIATLTLLCYIYIQYGNIYAKKIIATIPWEAGWVLYENKSFEKAIIEYDRIYLYMKDNPRYLFEYGRAYNKIGQFEKSNKILKEGALLSSDPMFYNIIGNNYKELEAFESAEKNYLFAHHILPDRMYPIYLLMKLYERTGQQEKMNNMANMIITFNTKVESTATDEMRTEASKMLNK